MITGGDSDLGFACASAILKSRHGALWRVVLACRDEGRAQAAVDQLTCGAGVAGQVEAMSVDLASLASVRAFAAELTKRLSTGTTPPLHAVVCNAGSADPAIRRIPNKPSRDQTYGRSSCAGAASAIRASLIRDPAQQAEAHQLPQPISQHMAGNPERGLESLEPPLARKVFAQDQRAPAICQSRRRCGRASTVPLEAYFTSPMLPVASRASSESEASSEASMTTNRLLVSRPSKNIRVHDVNRCACCIRDYLVEDLGELELVVFARDVADVRGGQHVGQ